MLYAGYSIASYEGLLASKERELIAQRAEVWSFIDTNHTAKETKEYQAEIRKSDIEIGNILNSLLLKQDVTDDFRLAATSLCQRCRDLGNYTKDMQKALAEDLAERNRIEDNQTSHIIRNVGFLILVPSTLVAAVKSGVGEGAVNVTQAAAAGVGVGATILSRKKLLGAFRSACKSVCSLPREIKSSFMLYYMKETLKEKAKLAAESAMRVKSNLDEVPAVAQRTKRRALNLFRGPKT